MVRSELRRIGAVAVAIAITFACLIAYAVHGSLPHNPISLPLESELATRAWAPEGWKFFTRSPREEQALLFVRDAGRWRRAEAGSASRPEYLFGIDRTGRAQGLELGMLLAELPQRLWRDCNQSPLVCVASSPASMSIVNRSPQPTLCGAVGLVMQKPVPWSWRDLSRPVILPSRFVRLEVQC